MATTATTRRKSSASTRTERLVASIKPGAAWLLVFHVVVMWRDSTWPVAGTAISAVTAMAGSVL